MTLKKQSTRRAPRARHALAYAGFALSAAALAAVSPTPVAADTVLTNYLPAYTPPSDPLPLDNGDLVYPENADLAEPFTVGPKDYAGNYVNLPYAKDFHLIMYRTTSARGEPVVATGMVIRSRANLANYPTGSVRPLVAYAPGNQGVGDPCASSFAVRNGAWYENFPVNGLLSKGFDVVVPDYQGLGVNDGQVHAVANNRANGQATLDALRAAELAMPDFLPTASPVPLRMAVWGYSEGGGAAAWAASHIAYAAPSVQEKIAAVAAGGATADLKIVGQLANGQDQVSRPPVDFAGNVLVNRFTIPHQDMDGNGVLDNQNVNVYSALVLMAAAGMQATYEPVVPGEVPYDHSQFYLPNKLSSNGLNWTQQIKQKCLVDGLAVAAGLHVDSFVQNTDGSAGTLVAGKIVYPADSATAKNPLTNSVWKQKFDELNPAYGNAAPTVPTYLYHGSKDVAVAYPQAVELRERWCSITSHAPIYWRRYNGSEHVQTWGFWASAVTFVQQQLYKADGRPNNADTAYPDNCATAP